MKSKFDANYKFTNSEALLKKLLKKFKEEYKFLYDNDNKVAGYYDALYAFNDDFKNIEGFDTLVKDFVHYRGDFLSSDRECAAFEFACESLGLFLVD